ncbi:hypothetical protein ACPPVS_18610 [Cellulomonas sp. McL0617]
MDRHAVHTDHAPVALGPASRANVGPPRGLFVSIGAIVFAVEA